MKRRELLKLAPVVAVAAVVPAVLMAEKQKIIRSGYGNPERLLRKKAITLQHSDDDGLTWVDTYPTNYSSSYMTPEYLKAQEDLNQWTSDQLRVLKSRKAPPLKLNKII